MTNTLSGLTRAQLQEIVCNVLVLIRGFYLARIRIIQTICHGGGENTARAKADAKSNVVIWQDSQLEITGIRFNFN